MATTSIWRVNGWLGKVVVYIENPDKTDNPAFYERPELTEEQAQGLSDVIDYAVNSRKTQATDAEVLRSFVSGVNCHPSTAREEMLAVKRRFGKQDGTMAYHGYQSFAPGEATPEMAHEIGVKLARRLWGDRYQVLVATHLDKANHLHNHFVLNTVSFVDGIKYHRTAKDYRDMQTASDELCREYGLSVVEQPQQGKSRQYGEWRAEQEQRPTWRGIIRADVDEAIRQSMTERQFFENLRRKGYEIKVGKEISVRPPHKERFLRLARNFGEDYTAEGIRRRILAQPMPELPVPKKSGKYPQRRMTGTMRTTKKAKGFRALYFHYCYLLGIFPKNKPKTNNKRLHFLLKEDLIQMEAISQEARLLARNQIDTAEQLCVYKESLNSKISALSDSRRELYRKLRSAAVKADPAEQAAVKAEIAALSKEIAAQRKEVKLAEDIAVRSGVMSEKLKAVREDEQIKGKEKKRYEHIR